jgi:hypothetical protein
MVSVRGGRNTTTTTGLVVNTPLLELRWAEIHALKPKSSHGSSPISNSIFLALCLVCPDRNSQSQSLLVLVQRLPGPASLPTDSLAVLLSVHRPFSRRRSSSILPFGSIRQLARAQSPWPPRPSKLSMRRFAPTQSRITFARHVCFRSPHVLSHALNRARRAPKTKTNWGNSKRRDITDCEKLEHEALTLW